MRRPVGRPIRQVGNVAVQRTAWRALLGDAHEATLGDLSFRFAPSARRFDLGNYNYAACAAVNASMQQLLAWGTANIDRYVTALAHALARGFIDLGFAVSGGAPGKHLANIVTVGTMSADHYATGDARYNELYGHLSANRVKLSIRRGTLRFSLHVYNSMEDVERVLNDLVGVRDSAVVGIEQGGRERIHAVLIADRDPNEIVREANARLEDHQKIFALLPAVTTELGMSLSPAYQLIPEQSTAAIIVHHPKAKYYSVGESRVEQLMK